MKKYLSILSAMGLLLFTACSKDDLAKEMSPEEKTAAIIAEANMPSDVQIRLGFGSHSNGNSASVTRAPLESDDDDMFETPEGKFLGIYCLAQYPNEGVTTSGPVDEPYIEWTADSVMMTRLMVLNQPARVVKKQAGEKIGGVTLTSDACDVQFLTNNRLVQKHYYYPYGNWYNYHFYAYYPRVNVPADGTVHNEARKISVDMELDGTKDVIYAKAMPDIDHPDAAVNREGFNATYMRSLQNSAGINQQEDLPNLALEHKLAQLRFYVKCGSYSYDSYGYGPTTANGKKLFQIQDLRLIKMPSEWTLTVADKDSPANEGKLTKTSSATLDIPVKYISLNPTTGRVNSTQAEMDEDAFDQTDASTIAAGRQNIPFEYREVKYMKVVLNDAGDDYVWEYTTKQAYEGAVQAGSGVALDKNVAADNSLLIANNANKIYKQWIDTDGDDHEDVEPLLVGYAMVPTTAMMESFGDVDGRGNNSVNPYIQFTIWFGETTEANTGESWQSNAQAIPLPDGKYLPGHVYNVILNIPPPEEINMTASLAHWKVFDVTDEDEDHNVEMTVQ